jgi:hypothetical protein
MVVLPGGSKVNGWKRSHSLVPESRKSGVGTALLRSPAQSGMASATRSARLSLAFEGNLQSNISSTLLTKQGMVKVYGGVLRPEIEYKTVAVSLHTTAKELVSLVLEKYDCPTRDRNLYYVVMITGKSPNGIIHIVFHLIKSALFSYSLSIYIHMSACLPVCLYLNI